MRSVVPLPDHPELVITHSNAWSEYRVQNIRLWKKADSTAQTVVECFWADTIVCLGLSMLWPILSGRNACKAGLAVMVVLYAYSRCTRVLWESVVILHSLGLQLETQRGLPLVPLFTSRRFIPLTSLRDFVINEGLRGWSVHYYLAVMQQSSNGNVTIDVPFQNIMPRFPVLLEIYHGVHELLFDSPTSSISQTCNI
ncbi:uncharacterized protein B0H18DRAFT_927263 [Fomitopsis serialis]|uniref:uncharacterized protein n=1 Tax=Fomitopsis serialis TaxID=139415 RepID=UPI002008BD32|nr:uncharacterized protein B0H18DRAFT_927263 [Neoantrodia serialis]KAH9934662.1 hypothetical protein B0H18DRAFT_927263 [Neoantrodia serialis]